MRSAFTLVEVNLAIFIMAVGVLAMVSLYSLGFRESRQSEEDVAAAGYADAFFAPLVAELSSTNMTWSRWCQIGDTPSGGNDAELSCDAVTQSGKGWGAFARSVGDEKSGRFRINDCNGLSDDVFSEILGKAQDGVSRSAPSQKPDFYGLVATRRGGMISLAFRCSRRKDLLLSQPVYYTEVHFQGRGDQ